MAAEWYRRKTWTFQDETAFFARLNRSRSRFHKAQYLRIQAGELAETAVEENLRAAVSLLELLLAEYPEPGEIAASYWQLGKCKERLHKSDEAVQAYRLALLQQRIYPNVISNAHISLAVLVAKERRRAEYDEALQALTEWGRLGDFPVMDFEMCAARAIIYAETGNQDDAVQWANDALAAAAKTHSGYRYHAALGLVGNQHADLVERMRKITAG